MGSYLQEDKSNFLWMSLLPGVCGMKQEDLKSSWSPSATAFVREGKRDGGKKCLMTQDGILRAKNWGRASLLGELCVAASAERSAPCCPCVVSKVLGWMGWE